MHEQIFNVVLKAIKKQEETLFISMKVVSPSVCPVPMDIQKKGDGVMAYMTGRQKVG